jgi:DNA (cytosine-5)-methyltransferase 1
MANAGTKLWLGNQEAFSGDYRILQPTISFDERNIQFFSNQNYSTSPTLTATDNKGAKGVMQPIPIHDQASRFNGSNNGKGNGLGIGKPGDPMPTLDTSSRHATFHNMAVRRLTPVECERLQGFPDNYTNIPKAADGNRYKALGNSMAVPVMRWIGERINEYERKHGRN